ncbi:MAG: ribonuclease E inhibitor RraB, partial [Pirellulaceae bacterium]
EDAEDATEPWTCECSKVMLLTYDNINAAQYELNEIAKPLGAYVDGWGTFGNADE